MNTLRQQFQTLIQLALDEDLGLVGDVTSRATIDPDTFIETHIIAKQSGVIAGLEAVTLVYEAIDPDVQLSFLVRDGDKVNLGDVICEIRGNAYSVLSGERTALNFLQRLSGIASLTRQFVDAIHDTQATILDTRKTHPGWRLLDKFAVKAGGGHNHRMGLHDMVLIKDNHIDAAGGIKSAVIAVKKLPEAQKLPIEVEVKDLDELRIALELDVDRIMLDNMSLHEMRNAVAITDDQVALEASGNVNLSTVRDIAETGVDYISVGALTHSSPILDLSMRVLQTKK